MIKKKNKYLSSQDEIWLFSFCIVTFCIISLLYFSIFTQDFFLQKLLKKNSSTQKKSKYIMAFIGNPKEETLSNSHKEIKFLGKKEQSGLGRLTTGKGFRSPSSQRLLRVAPAPTPTPIQPTAKDMPQEGAFILEKIITEMKKSSKHVVRKKKNISPLNTAQKQIPASEKDTINQIPFYLKEGKEFVFSYNNWRQLRIPTIGFEHYDYFTKMFDKIKENWAPPGLGMQYLSQKESIMSWYVPGRLKIRLFPEHKIYFTFVINEKGDVVDVRIDKSMNYKKLDDSILSAVKRAKNFSQPPRKILKNGYLVVPVVIYIQ